MKRGLFLFSPILISLLLISCHHSAESMTAVQPNRDPEPYPSDRECPLNVQLESDYSNIVLKTMESSYQTDTEKIVCEIENQTPGKGFYFSIFRSLNISTEMSG